MRVGFVSTRFSGTDGVSLESAKWAEVLEEMGHEIFWFSGLSERPKDRSFCVPEAFFGHPENKWINEKIWGVTRRDPIVTERIRETAAYLEIMLRRFVDHFSIDVIVSENASTIPVHVPLGVALTEFMAETGILTIAHHHDFYWERVRFSVNAVPDFLDMSFPPRLPNIMHTVINRQAREQLALRKGVSSILVPNSFNFEEEPPGIDEYTADFREEIGLEKDDILILQPTRIVPRKGIEHAIKLIGRLKNEKCKLIISHSAGDEGYEYQNMLEKLAEDEGVDLRIVADRINERRQLNSEGRKMYTLWDIYPHADLVTYPSIYEGFGNALLEAFYFRKLVVVNRYAIYIQDIEPKGFNVIEMDGHITDEVVQSVKRNLTDETLKAETVDHNYKLATRYFGYQSLKESLKAAFDQLTYIS